MSFWNAAPGSAEDREGILDVRTSFFAGTAKSTTPQGRDFPGHGLRRPSSDDPLEGPPAALIPGFLPGERAAAPRPRGPGKRFRDSETVRRHESSKIGPLRGF